MEMTFISNLPVTAPVALVGAGFMFIVAASAFNRPLLRVAGGALQVAGALWLLAR